MKISEYVKPSLLSISIAIILLAIVLVFRANLLTTELPLSVNSAKAIAWYGQEVVVLEYKRTFTVTDNFIGTVIRSVKCNNGRSYDLPDTTRKFKEGTFSTRRTVMLPYTIAVGTKCLMVTSVAWQPTLSFMRFIQDIEEVPFEVVIYGSSVDDWTPTNEEGS